MPLISSNPCTRVHCVEGLVPISSVYWKSQLPKNTEPGSSVSRTLVNSGMPRTPSACCRLRENLADLTKKHNQKSRILYQDVT